MKCKGKCVPCESQVLPRTHKYANVTLELKNKKPGRPKGTNPGSVLAV